MSDSSKQQRSGATPIKNPLLSASVTGLTFDDFPNKPFLLPAAPPIVHAPPAPVVTPSNLVAREPKSLVIVGSSSLDTENLDEINLNASSEDNQSSELSDPNANSLLEQSNPGSTSDSILSQAASSFSALPSVASNVFSTFSKRINAISSRETTPINEQYQADPNANTFVPQLDIQPSYTQQQPADLTQTAAPPPPTQFYPPPQGGSYFASTPQLASASAEPQTNLPPPEPPKFYTPADVPALPSGTVAPPSTALGGQNNFRFSSKKKLYAPIPGLSEQSQPATATLDPSTVSAPISYDNSAYGNYPTNDPYQQYPTAEERKPTGGLFSKISNFAPTGVLQNITGLVQSAAGSLTQTIRPESTTSYNQPQVPSSVTFDPQSNYFGGPPPPTNFFVPPTFGGQQGVDNQTESTSATLTQPPPPPFFIPQQTAGFNLAGPPPAPLTQPIEFGVTQTKAAEINFFDPTKQTAQLESTPLAQPENFFNPPLQPPQLKSDLSENQTSQTQIPFFNPSDLPSQPPQPLRPNRPHSRPPSHPSSSYCPQANPTANDQEAISFYNPTQSSHPAPVPQVALFDPTKTGLTAAPPSQTIQPPLPPSIDTTLPPSAGGQTSYRLQKGTKLYKNPLTPQETAPIQVTPQQIAQPAVPPSIYTGFPPQQTQSTSPSLYTGFAPQQVPFTPIPNPSQFPPNQGVSNIHDANPYRSNFVVSNTEPQSVPLFAPSIEETKSEELKTNVAEQSVPLFSAPVEENKPDLLETNESFKNNPLYAATAPLEETIPVELRTESNVTESQVLPQPVAEDNSSSFFFKPIEPVSNSEAFNPVIDSSKNLEESLPILETIEPVIKDKENLSQNVSELIQSVEDPLEQTLQKLSLTTESVTETKALTLPPPTTQAHTLNNPYRRGSTSESVKPAVAQPTLANFFTPGPSVAGSGDLNFFATLAATEPDLTNTDKGINFFSNPLPEKETSQETGNFFQTSQTEPTTQTQAYGFFHSTPTEAEIQTIEPKEKEATKLTTESESLLQTAITDPTTNTQTLGFFIPATSETVVNPQNPQEKEIPSTESIFQSSVNPPQTSNYFSPTLPEAVEVSTKETLTSESFFHSSINPPQSSSNFFAPSQTDAEVASINLLNKPDLIPDSLQTKEQDIVPTIAFFPPLPTNIGVIPSVLGNQEDISKNLNDLNLATNVPPPIGFDNFIQQIQTPLPNPGNTTVQPENTTLQQVTPTTQPQQHSEVVNRFSNYFNNQTQIQTEIPKDPSTFFDSFAIQQPQSQPLAHPGESVDSSILESSIPPSVVTNEEQRIQYFFNNPPPKDAGSVGDLNYDLVHSGLGIKKIQQRSLTPVSNLVEPPSSACSEFSEFSNSTAGQKTILADLSLNEIVEKPIVKEISKPVNTAAAPAVESNIKHYEELPEEILRELRMANLISADKSVTTPTASVSYKPAVKHWFYKRIVGGKIIWMPFSHYDSALLETSLLMEGDEKPNIVAVEGGRYDVNISERKKMSVYWDSEPIEVRRCSWFYKAVDSKNVPYEEQTAEVLENEYKHAAESGVWHKTIILGMGEQVVFHGPTVIVHFQQQQNTDAWGGSTTSSTRPRVVKRDLDDFNIEQGESQRVDHLLFMVHGIGSACDLKLRSVEEVVEDFRTIARQLVQSHYKNSTDMGLVGRVEVLPISWHSHLHSVELGIDEKLRMITLESIPKLRNFTNDTLLDILFYTSPTFCQKIMNTIVSSMNGMYLKYRERHPEFNGGVSLAGHSLGSIILFDLLCHQNPIKESEEKNLENPDEEFLTGASGTQIDSNQLEPNHIGYTMGPAGTGQPFINYGQLIFQPKKFFALGSPIGMFVTIRGIDKLGLDFRLPTCPGFYNIFHPYDPVAYRIEALVNTDLSGVRPVLIPHHKGRKRMHLELKETMTRVSMDLKHRFLDKFKTTLDSVNIFGPSTKTNKEAEELMEKEVEKVIQMQIQLERQDQPTHAQLQDKLSPGDDSQSLAVPPTRLRTDSVSTVLSDDIVEIDFPLGKLNDSKRIDYVLQEAPLEFFNEYIFALSSHVCYWDSEDTILFVMKEIYSGLGISPDSQVPQQTMTIERPSSRNSLLSLT